MGHLGKVWQRAELTVGCLRELCRRHAAWDEGRVTQLGICSGTETAGHSTMPKTFATATAGAHALIARHKARTQVCSRCLF